MKKSVLFAVIVFAAVCAAPSVNAQIAITERSLVSAIGSDPSSKFGIQLRQDFGVVLDDLLFVGIGWGGGSQSLPMDGRKESFWSWQARVKAGARLPFNSKFNLTLGCLAGYAFNEGGRVLLQDDILAKLVVENGPVLGGWAEAAFKVGRHDCFVFGVEPALSRISCSAMGEKVSVASYELAVMVRHMNKIAIPVYVGYRMVF